MTAPVQISQRAKENATIALNLFTHIKTKENTLSLFENIKQALLTTEEAADGASQSPKIDLTPDLVAFLVDVAVNPAEPEYRPVIRDLFREAGITHVVFAETAIGALYTMAKNEADLLNKSEAVKSATMIYLEHPSAVQIKSNEQFQALGIADYKGGKRFMSLFNRKSNPDNELSVALGEMQKVVDATLVNDFAKLIDLKSKQQPAAPSA